MIFLEELLIDQQILEFGGVELYFKGVEDWEPVLNTATSNPQEVRSEGGVV